MGFSGGLGIYFEREFRLQVSLERFTGFPVPALLTDFDMLLASAFCFWADDIHNHKKSLTTVDPVNKYINANSEVI